MTYKVGVKPYNQLSPPSRFRARGHHMALLLQSTLYSRYQWNYFRFPTQLNSSHIKTILFQRIPLSSNRINQTWSTEDYIR